MSSIRFRTLAGMGQHTCSRYVAIYTIKPISTDIGTGLCLSIDIWEIVFNFTCEDSIPRGSSAL